MFQAMLCDDNEIILEGLSRQIDWEGLGICLSGTAADGQDAWNQMKDNPPDILITDIRMPYIDGLELSRLAKDLNPNIVLLIISAYDDFEYARTAMHLRALDYILKPIDLDAMNRILTNAVSHCRQFHHDKRLMATQLLRNMAVQEAAGPEGIVLNELDLEPDSWCCFLQVELDDHSLSKLSDNIRYASERRFSALSQILFGDSSYLLESHQYSYSVCLTSRSRMELAARRKILVDTIRRQFPHEGSYCDVSIASGSIVQGIRLLHKSVQTCHEAGKLHFIKGSNADIFYEEVESYIYNEPEDSQGYPIPDTRLITFIKEQNKEGITGELEQLKTWLYQKGSESYLYMTFSLGSFYTHLMKELGESGINLQDIFQNPIEEFKKVAAGGTLESSIENLKQNLFKICDSIRINKSRYGKLIDQAILYIQNHYMSSSFSIDEVAGAVCLSTSYFSTVFKSETGITFTDYLIKVRMEKARGLLENTNMKMYEISSRAGYENAAFSAPHSNDIMENPPLSSRTGSRGGRQKERPAGDWQERIKEAGAAWRRERIKKTYASLPGHSSRRKHSQHFGRLAMQMVRPRVMICMFHRIQWSLGSTFIRSYSIFSGSSSFVRPSFPEIRFTWVSTTILGSLYMFPRITLAVLRPTPAREVSSSMVLGTSPPKRSTRSRQQAMIFLAFM